MPPKKSTKNSANKCVFCYCRKDEEEVYGKMLRKFNLTVHYFCMLFSSGLWQRGKRDSDGILGFMPSDIKREQKRGLLMHCHFCGKKGATIRCTVKTCEKEFHYRCGRDAGGLFQFYEQFRSFCPEHRLHQQIPTGFSAVKTICSICMLDVEVEASSDVLCTPCCGVSWFHKMCIQRYAMSAGAYFFKCPLCNNKELFEAEMLKFGIYIPEQDAAWEREPNAYQELLERYSNCDADKCLCPQGRSYADYKGTQWEMLLCPWCGSSGTHVRCNGFVDIDKDSVCQECAEINLTISKYEMKQKKDNPEPKSPRIASSVKELQQQLESQRTRLLRARLAQIAARNQTSSPSPGPSTMWQTPSSLSESASQTSEDEEYVPVASSSVLNDHRLINSTPVVRIERASSETEINVWDTDEEEEEEEAIESDDSGPQGCARLMSLCQVNSLIKTKARSSSSEQWDVKGVVEDGQKKVVLLFSMDNSGKDKSSKLASDKASSSFSSKNLSSSFVPNKPLSNFASDNPSSSTSVRPSTSGLHLGQVLQLSSDEETDCYQEDMSSHHGNASESKKHRFHKKKLSKDKRDDTSSDEEESTTQRQNRLLISPDRKRALMQTLSATVQPKSPLQDHIFQISDSSSEENNSITIPMIDSEEEGGSGDAPDFTDNDNIQIKLLSLPQSTADNTNVIENSPVSQQKSVTSSAQGSISVARSVYVDVILMSAEQTSNTEVSPSNQPSTIPSLSQTSCDKKTTSESWAGKPAPSASKQRTKKRSGVGISTEPIQNARSLSLPAQQTAPSVSGPRQNSLTKTRYEQTPVSAGSENVGADSSNIVRLSDDVIAMHQHMPPSFAQFQVPKPAGQSSRVPVSNAFTVPAGYSLVPPCVPGGTSSTMANIPSFLSCSPSPLNPHSVPADTPSGMQTTARTPVPPQASGLTSVNENFYITIPTSTTQTQAFQPVTSHYNQFSSLAEQGQSTIPATSVSQMIPAMTQRGVQFIPASIVRLAQSRLGLGPQLGSQQLLTQPTQVQSYQNMSQQFNRPPLQAQSSQNVPQPIGRQLPQVQSSQNVPQPIGRQFPLVQSSQNVPQPIGRQLSQVQGSQNVPQPGQSVLKAGQLRPPLPPSTTAKSSVPNLSEVQSYQNLLQQLPRPPGQFQHFPNILQQLTRTPGQFQQFLNVSPQLAQGQSSQNVSQPSQPGLMAGQPKPMSALPPPPPYPTAKSNNPYNVPTRHMVTLLEQLQNSQQVPADRNPGQSHQFPSGQAGSVAGSAVSSNQSGIAASQSGISASLPGITASQSDIAASLPGIPASQSGMIASQSGMVATPRTSVCHNNGDRGTSTLFASASNVVPVNQRASLDHSAVHQPACSIPFLSVNENAISQLPASQFPHPMAALQSSVPSDRTAMHLTLSGTPPRTSTPVCQPSSVPVRSVDVEGLSASSSRPADSVGQHVMTESRPVPISLYVHPSAPITSPSHLINIIPPTPAQAAGNSGTAQIRPQTPSLVRAKTPTAAQSVKSKSPASDHSLPASKKTCLQNSPLGQQSPTDSPNTKSSRPVKQSTSIDVNLQKESASKSAPVHSASKSVMAQPNESSAKAGISSESDSSLAISRGKIWLATEHMQTQVMKNTVVTLSDSDDSDDMEIVEMSPEEPTSLKLKPVSTGHHCSHSKHKTDCDEKSVFPKDVHTKDELIPTPHRPPCPVHGHFRLVHHPQPTIPAKRNADGSLTIDLTEYDPEVKKPRTEEVNLCSDNDSDLEIIS